jgi:2-polyprenyl-3-methyl-5-hydroxy-6-metoxy-1,4-benzoquinol methylase
MISPSYRELLLKKHAAGKWGADGAKHADAVLAYADELEAETILDYGCGEMALAEAIKDRRRVSGFDPGVPGREGMPKPCDLVVCTDMLEHAELERLNDVLGHIRSICLKGAYFVISTKPAKAILADGRNAHLIVHPAAWWIKGLTTAGFTISRSEVIGEKEVRVWALK